MEKLNLGHFPQRKMLPWLTGAAWLLAGITSLIRDEPTHVLDMWMIAPLTLTCLLLGRIASRYWASLPRYGRAGAVAILVSALPMAIGQLAATLDWDALKWLGFPTGVLAFAAGSALLGVALARHGLRPDWMGYAIALAQPAAMVTGVALSPIRELSDYGSYTGALAHGAIWLAIAHTLTKEENDREPAQVESASTLAA